jgi:hypothetical protein
MSFSFIYGVSLSFYFKENGPDLLYILLNMGAASLFMTIFIGEIFNRSILLLRGRKSSSRLKLIRRAIRVYGDKLNKLVTLRMFKLVTNQ